MDPLLSDPEIIAAARGPFRVVSTDRGDDSTLAILAPGSRDLRRAAGLCLDAAKHTKGALSVVDRSGDTVDPGIWRPGINAARNVGLSPR